MKCIQYVQSSTYIDVHIHRDPCVYLSLQKQNFKWICINKLKKKNNIKQSNDKTGHHIFVARQLVEFYG